MSWLEEIPSNNVTFLDYVVTVYGIGVYENEVEVLACSKKNSWRTEFPWISLIRWFKKNFSTIMAPMIEVIKGSFFKWNPKAQEAFEDIKSELNQAPVLALPCFDEFFEVKCDASGVGIWGVRP